MDAILLPILNGLDKGSAYALIALGLTLIFGTLGVVNFAHGALFMLGAFTAVSFRALLTLQKVTLSETETTAWGTPLETHVPYAQIWFGDFGNTLIEYSVPVSILLAVPFMLLVGLAMERGLIKHFYKRPHADQILVTFGLAIVLQVIIKAWFGANPIPQPAPSSLQGMVDVGAARGATPGNIVYPLWRFVYFGFAVVVIGAVFRFLRFTTFGMVVRAGMADRETVGLLGIDIDRRFTWMFGLAAVVAGLAGVMYTPILSPDYHLGMDFLVLSFVVVVVGGMGSLGGAVLAGFLLGILQSFASMNEVKNIFPGIDQIIIYLVAVVVLLARPRGLFGRKGVMES
jgi:branched-subunit amino acid ABC-type transport system permease component